MSTLISPHFCEAPLLHDQILADVGHVRRLLAVLACVASAARCACRSVQYEIETRV